MSLDFANEKLGWPLPRDVRRPTGEGARIFSELAKSKIQNALARLGNDGPQISVLSRNSKSTETETPLAIVAEFGRPASHETLKELHKLAWNFSHCPSLMTIEPDLLRVWTCCEPPKDRYTEEHLVETLPFAEFSKTRPSDASKRAAQSLHWINLISGEFFKNHATRFRRDLRADHTLLGNLDHVRTVLKQQAHLENDDICHDLLARVVFVQFLFHRKDSAGNSALNKTKLAALHESNVLKALHEDFASILSDYEETYRLFDWLNSKFNGDLFPGKGNTRAKREVAWREEKRHVGYQHLEILRDFVEGKLDMPSGQMCLWPQYAFDVIPLEFISSIYEAFVSQRARSEGIYYTPPSLVDFLLDRVLPWADERWDLKILDPACGSGVFLVKAFQRLIHRWKKAHAQQEIRAETLRSLLQRNLLGVDKDPHAVRVASFSLYLAMCDEIDPKHYWTQVHFPPLREHRLINADFFKESEPAFSTETNSSKYDLIIGNPPWGGESLTSEAERWAERHNWPVAERGIGTLFLAKALSLAKKKGRISLLQPARTLLFNQRGPAAQFRQKLLSEHSVEEVINFSALRFDLFPHAADPVCAITVVNEKPRTGVLTYSSPKRTFSSEEATRIVIEPLDIHRVDRKAAEEGGLIWSGFIWGSRRDLALVRRLRDGQNLKKLERNGLAKLRRGISRGDLLRKQPEIKDRPILETDEFPPGTFLFLDASSLPINTDVRTHSKDSTDFSAFSLPQLIIKQSWQKGHFRFQAAIVRTNSEARPVLCSRSYASVHVLEGREDILYGAWLSLRSKLAVYFLLLTSGRFASYREEPNLADIFAVPVPELSNPDLSRLSTVDDVDRFVRHAFDLKDSEWVLIEDMFNVTLPDFKGNQESPGRRRTFRGSDGSNEPDLRSYSEYFIRVLKAGFGADKSVSATIFADTELELPYRLVAFELKSSLDNRILVSELTRAKLLDDLATLNEMWLMQDRERTGSIFYQRVCRIYAQRGDSLSVFIVKPDAYRYWTRSMGMQDADAVAADFARWQSVGKSRKF